MFLNWQIHYNHQRKTTDFWKKTTQELFGKTSDQYVILANLNLFSIDAH